MEAIRAYLFTRGNEYLNEKIDRLLHKTVSIKKHISELQKTVEHIEKKLDSCLNVVLVNKGNLVTQEKELDDLNRYIREHQEVFKIDIS